MRNTTAICAAVITFFAASCVEAPRSPQLRESLQGAATVDVVGVLVTEAGTRFELDATTLPHYKSGADCRWEQQLGPTVVLVDPNACVLEAEAPLQRTQLVLRVQIVRDDGIALVDYAVRVTNETPKVVVSAVAVAKGGAEVQLDGSKTVDADDGQKLSFAWKQTGGPSVALKGASLPIATFIAGPTKGAVLQFELTVTDGVDKVTSKPVVVEVGNHVPIAYAGEDFDVLPGEEVVVQGAVSDGDNDPLELEWSQISGPTLALQGTDTDTVTFTAPNKKGPVVLALVAKDDEDKSPPSHVEIHIGNSPPLANAGPNQAVAESALVTLNGSGSGDPDGDELHVTWTQLTGPSITISDLHSLTPTFVAPDWQCLLVFRLRVWDGTAVRTDQVQVSVANGYPVALVANEVNAQYGEPVILDASASYDPNGDDLTYHWQRVSGPYVSLHHVTKATPSFVAPMTPAELVFRVAVCDGMVCSTPKTTRVHVDNGIPELNVPEQVVVEGGSQVTIEAEAVDPDGDVVTWQWNCDALAIGYPNSPNPTFQVPVAAQSFVLDVVVSDGFVQVEKSVTVTVANHVPTVSAGSDKTVDPGSLVTLSGSVEDLDGDALLTAWTLVQGVDVELADPQAVKTHFVATAPKGPRVFQLSADDGTSVTTDTVTMWVTNSPPTADAGALQAVAAGADVTLQGAGTDPDGDALTWRWTQVDGDVVELVGDDTAWPQFSAPASKAALTFELVVKDGEVESAPSLATVHVGNAAPVADAGTTQQVGPGAFVTLKGGHSFDPDGDEIAFQWVQTGGDEVVLSDSTAAEPTFVAPTKAQSLTFSLTTDDGWAQSVPGAVEVVIGNLPPAVHPPKGALEVAGGAVVTLVGEATDPNGDDLVFQWLQTGGDLVEVQGADGDTLTFTAPAAKQTITFEVEVTDALGESDSVEFEVVVLNSAPVAHAVAPQAVDPGDLVTLSGASSTDADGDALTWKWKQVEGDTVALSDYFASTPTFEAPVGRQILVFTLQVFDGEVWSTAVEVEVQVKNSPPVAVFVDQCAAPSSLAWLDGMNSTDADGDALTYHWSQLTGTPVTLGGETTSAPTLIAPEIPQTMKFLLTVHDGIESGLPVVGTLTVSESCSD